MEGVVKRLVGSILSSSGELGGCAITTAKEDWKSKSVIIFFITLSYRFYKDVN